MPFDKNDPRINRTGLNRGSGNTATAKTLARKERRASIEALARLRDTAEDEAVQYRAAERLLIIADGLPKAMAAEPEEPQAPISTDGKTDDELTAELSAAPTEGEA